MSTKQVVVFKDGQHLGTYQIDLSSVGYELPAEDYLEEARSAAVEDGRATEAERDALVCRMLPL